MMKLKEIKIAWTSCDPCTDVPFQACLTFQVLCETPEKAYTEAVAAMRACLIEEGAQYDPAILREVA